MANHSFRPEGSPFIIPGLVSRNPEASLEFYESAFGFTKKVELRTKDGKIMHAELSHYDGTFMLWPESPKCSGKAPATSGTPPAVTLYVYCEDVDALSARARDAGAKVISPPENMFWGDRVCNIEDPDGYLWTFATKVGEFDASKMPT